MQLTAVAMPAPSGPADRARAADRLAYVASIAAQTAELAAARFDAAGTRVTRGDLLADLFATLSPIQLGSAIDDAIEGALAVAPEEAWRRPDLRWASDSIVDILFHSATDPTVDRPWAIFDAMARELDEAAAPLLDAAAAIAPRPR
jgi:hypothetical protein